MKSLFELSKLVEEFEKLCKEHASYIQVDCRDVLVIGLGAATDTVLNYLESIWQPEQIYFTPNGVVVVNELMMTELQRLSAWLRSLKSADVCDQCETQDDIPLDHPDDAQVWEAMKRELGVDPAFFAWILEETPVRSPDLTTITPEVNQSLRWRVCCSTAVADRLAESNLKPSERKTTLEKLSKRPERLLPAATREHVRNASALLDSFPNFKPAIDLVVRHLKWLRATDMPLGLPPILLSGPPGIGKTEFARRLAEVLSANLELRSFAEMSASFVITGSHKTWSGGNPGLVAKVLADLPEDRLPMVLIDEIDKVHEHANHPPDRALLSLLESQTARVFRDECLDIELNAQPIAWLFTCNDLEMVRPEIRSRLRMVEIRSPTKAQMPAVVKSVDDSVRKSNPAIGKLFRPLDARVTAKLNDLNPRALVSVLLEIYGIAIGEGRKRQAKRRVTAVHVAEALQTRNEQIGELAIFDVSIRRSRVKMGFVPEFIDPPKDTRRGSIENYPKSV